MWITRGMFVPHIPPVTHTNPPPAHTTPGKVQGYSDSFSITGFFQKTRWETRIDPIMLHPDFQCLNFDLAEHRPLLAEQSWDRDKALLIFDESHKAVRLA